MQVVNLIVPVFLFCVVYAKDEPTFAGQETNVTVVLGRDATLTCKVENLQSYKVAWLRVDTQTILTIGHHVITKNHRVAVSRRDQAWSLTLRDVRPADGGHYMCQINTEPMITQTHHLHVSAKYRLFVNVEVNCVFFNSTDSSDKYVMENILVAWLRVDTQTILTIGHHVITKNHRVAVSRRDQAWSLTLRDVRPADGGHYMCQINTEPMITQTHHLHVSVPPDIVDSDSSGEVIVWEGDNVTLHCAASGTPQPTILWRREDSAAFNVAGETVSKWNGAWLNLTSVSRDMNGALLCIATNGVPPSVSKRILLHVLCKPTARISQKMLGVYVGETMQLRCRIEANPPPTVYWTHIDLNKLYNGSKYQTSLKSQGYKYTALLRVRNMSREDIGSYYCYAENSMGTARDDVTIYTLATTTSTSTEVTTVLEDVTTTPLQTYAELEVKEHDPDIHFPHEDRIVVVLSQHQMQNLDFSPSS